MVYTYICCTQNFILGLNRRDVAFIEEETKFYINTWLVRVLGGAHAAKALAKQLGFDPHVEVSQRTKTCSCMIINSLLIFKYSNKWVFQVSDAVSNVYLFRYTKGPVKMKYADEHLISKLRAKPQVNTQ